MREPIRIDYDLTKDYVDRLERLNGLADGTRKDPHLRHLDNVAYWMFAILLLAWIIGNW
jgi:uncharacterized membrane protein